MRVCDTESCYNNISKIRNVTFVSKISKNIFNNEEKNWKSINKFILPN